MNSQLIWSCLFAALMFFLLGILTTGRKKKTVPADAASKAELAIIRGDGRYCPKHLVRYEIGHVNNSGFLTTSEVKRCPECQAEKDKQAEEKKNNVDELVKLIHSRKPKQ